MTPQRTRGLPLLLGIFVTGALLGVAGIAARPAVAAAASASAPADGGGNCPAQPFADGVWPICAPASYSGGLNPTYTGPGAQPVTESACQQFSNGVGGCEFVTANGNRFTISLPSGFVAKYQGTATLTGNNMAVIAAIVKDLNPAEYASANASGVPSDLSVSPSYAALLATVGVTPSQFLAWQLANVPADQRMPWDPGSAFTALVNGVGVAATTAASASAPPTTAPSATKTAGGTTASAPATSATKASAASPATAPAPVASVYPSTTTQAPPAQVSAEKASAAASGTGASGTASSPGGSAAAPAPTSSTVSPGGVIQNPADCPSGESAVVEPQGGRCVPDAPLGVALHPVPKPAPSLWASISARLAPLRPYRVLLGGGVLLVVLGVTGGVVIRRLQR